MTAASDLPRSEVCEPAPAGSDAQSVSANVRKGGLWVVASNMLLRLGNVLLTAIVAHILSPHDFGVFAVALTAYAIVSSLGELGLSACLIRADLDIDRLAPTVATIAVLSGTVLAAAMAAFARPIATALGSAAAVGPIRVMSLAVFLLGVFAVPNSQMVRDFKQGQVFLANVIGFIPSTVLLIILAKLGSGAMAFAWSMVARQFAVGCVLIAVAPRRYRPGLARNAVSVILKFGIPLAGANFVNYILLNVDYAFVGHLLGAGALGVYMLAFTVASWPSGVLGAVINNVSMPAFSRVKHDPALLRKAMVTAVRAVSLIVMPMCAMTTTLARPLILTMYGAKWVASANVLAVLSLYGAVFMLCLLFANMLTALGRTKFLLALQLIWIGTLVPAMALGVYQDGVVGAAYAHVAVIVPIVLPSYLLALKRVTGVRLTALGRAALPAILASAAAALAARGAAMQLSSPLAQLIAGLAAGGLVYLICAGQQAIALFGRGRIVERVLHVYSTAARLVGLPSEGRAKYPVEFSSRSAAEAHEYVGRGDLASLPDLSYAHEGAGGYAHEGAGGQIQAVTFGRTLAGQELALGPYRRMSSGVTAPGPYHQMSSSVTALRRHRGAVPLSPAEARDRSVRRRVSATWGLLFFNTLTFVGGTAILPIPSHVGKALTQGALPLALLVGLTVNPKVKVRPNVFLCLVCLLVVDTLITSMQPQHLGTLYRTFRLAEFVSALWLLTPWWGRRDMLLLRCHLRWLFVALGSVLLGILIAPGHAFAQGGRLSGAIWPMFPTQVAQYAAVAAGVTVVLWLARLLSGRATLAGVTVAAAVLLLTHTRTALVSVVAGILVAGLSLFTINSRVRKFFAVGAAAVSIGVLTVAGVATTWLARGENAQGLVTLTGRTNFWALVLNQPRTRFQEIFGFGLSNASINGLPIDSNWLASYMMEGLFGVVVCAIVLAFLFVTAFFQPRGVRRALALFLVTYCTLASYTEVGFADVSTYLLHLTVAASLLVMPLMGRRAA